MEIAPISKDAEGQTIHLPKTYRLAGDQVYVKRAGGVIVLLPYNTPYSALFESLDDFTDDFIAERTQPSQPEREDSLT